MKIDYTPHSDEEFVSGLLEHTADRADIGLGATYGVLSFGLGFALMAELSSAPPMLNSLTVALRCATSQSIRSEATALLEHTSDRADIGLGATYGVLSFGRGIYMNTVHMLSEADTNKLPRSDQMISAMLF